MKAIPPSVIGGFSHCMQLVDSINRYLRSFSTRKIHYIWTSWKFSPFLISGFDPSLFLKENLIGSYKSHWGRWALIVFVHELFWSAKCLCKKHHKKHTHTHTKKKARRNQKKKKKKKEPTMWSLRLSFVAWFMGLSVLFQAPAQRQQLTEQPSGLAWQTCMLDL